jgi:hypothetical protein
MAYSSIESEYWTFANATAEILWLESLLQDLGTFISAPPTLWLDNIGAT